MGVKTASTTATRAKVSQRAVARAKTKAKEDPVVQTRGTRRNKRALGQPAALHQGKKILTPLLVSKILGLQLVPKHKLKLNQKKE